MQGAIGLLKRDPVAPSYFDNTREACVRSFQVMILVAPLHITLLMIRYSNVTTRADDLEIALVEALSYVVDWLLFPVVFYEIARRRNWLGQFPRYISALNWVNLPAMMIAVIGVVLTMLLPPPLDTVLIISLYGLLFYWVMITSRLVLRVNWPTAAILLIVSWVPSYLLSLIAYRFLGISAVGTLS